LISKLPEITSQQIIISQLERKIAISMIYNETWERRTRFCAFSVLSGNLHRDQTLTPLKISSFFTQLRKISDFFAFVKHTLLDLLLCWAHRHAVNQVGEKNWFLE
jgi:hypothetical protein